MENRKLLLDDSLFIGHGDHQETYIHPQDQYKCVKIPYDVLDKDIVKEMKYRRICEKKLRGSVLITKYYGTVDTSKGKGYIFERICDLDGKTSAHLEDFLRENSRTEKGIKKCQFILMQFRDDYLREKIVYRDKGIVNLMVQEIASNEWRIRIVDNIGTPSKIPIVYYLDWLAARKSNCYWNRLAEYLGQTYPLIVNKAFLDRLKV